MSKCVRKKIGEALLHLSNGNAPVTLTVLCTVRQMCWDFYHRNRFISIRSSMCSSKHFFFQSKSETTHALDFTIYPFVTGCFHLLAMFFPYNHDLTMFSPCKMFWISCRMLQSGVGLTNLTPLTSPRLSVHSLTIPHASFSPRTTILLSILHDVRTCTYMTNITPLLEERELTLALALSSLDCAVYFD